MLTDSRDSHDSFVVMCHRFMCGHAVLLVRTATLYAAVASTPHSTQAHPTMISRLSSYYIPVAKVVSAGIGVLHFTWEGSGRHLPSLPHVAL